MNNNCIACIIKGYGFCKRCGQTYCNLHDKRHHFCKGADMGCDIHSFLEYKMTKDTQWWSYGEIRLGRDYTLFSLLAQVRGQSNGFTPKGFPEDASFDSFDLYTYHVGESSDVTPEQAKAWVEQGHSKYTKHAAAPIGSFISSPDWHSASWLTLEELKKVQRLLGGKHLTLDALVSSMESIETIPNVKTRLVFFFDN